VIVVDNASTDATADIARAIPGVIVVHEPRKGLTHARAAGLRAATGDIVACLDADCRAPVLWLEQVVRHLARPGVVAVTGPFRYYDWHWAGRALLRLYDVVAAPAANLVVRDILAWGALLYGGNFAVRRRVLENIGGFDTSIEFHGEDTNLGRRLQAQGHVVLAHQCVMYTSARRYAAMGTWAVVGLYARNFWHEVLWHRPADVQHLDVRR
jgi:cellulose synthase/poly-beta-1,6-N-acetylglucosamine synthase-like glycosyltransferase